MQLEHLINSVNFWPDETGWERRTGDGRPMTGDSTHNSKNEGVSRPAREAAYKFEKLEVYQLALAYLDKMYALAERLPKIEQYNLQSQINPNVWMWFTPVLVLMMAGLGLGLGIIVSSMTTRYRDLRHLVSFGVQLLMYAAPVIYPLTSVPEKYRWVLLMNPMTPIIEVFRFAFLGAGVADLMYLLYSGASILVILVFGVSLFNRVQRTFMDTV